MAEDYYAVLGVSRSASAAELKSAYRKLAMKYHPDRNPGDAQAEAKFKAANEAYDVLKDDQKRAAYDRFGHEGVNGMGGGRGGAGFSGDFADMFDEIFGDMMGGRRGGGSRSASLRGSDLKYSLDITLEEAFVGKTATLRYPCQATCQTCGGSGSADNAAPSACRTCNGNGRVRVRQGFFVLEQTCPTCGGIGTVIENPCGECHGMGRHEQQRFVDVEVPPGIESGTRIRVPGQGEAGMRGHPAGDLYVFITIEPHRFFSRDGNDLGCSMPISLVTAALGGDMEIPGVDGKAVQVKIPEGVQAGQKLRLKGKGMKLLRAGDRRGDLYVEVAVETPRNLSRRQKELLREFADSSTASTNPETDGFIGKIRDWWDSVAS